MNKLLKADFYSLLKSKLTYILLIICAFVSLLSIFAYVAINALLKTELFEGAEIEGFVGLFNVKTISFGNFQLSNNIGLIIPIFAGIFTMSDIRHGTIRNKIIIGKKRTEIYLSHLIVSTTLCVVTSLISFLILLLGSLIFFEYGAEFNKEELLNFLRCLLIGTLTFVYVASVSTFFSLVTKSLPLTILLTLSVCLGLGIINSISAIAGSEKLKYLFYSIPTYANTILAQSGNLTVEEFLFGLGSYTIFIALNTALGIVLFKKSDLK